MGKDTGISWASHTFNAWSGCTHVSEGCDNCYAEIAAKRYGKEIWGDDAPREFRAEAYWAALPKWNAAAEVAGVRRRVFCFSWADIWEDRDDLVEHRARLLAEIERCTALDFLLLSKRPENAGRLLEASGFGHWNDGWPAHAWALATAESNERLEERAVPLLAIPAKVRGLSCEPLIDDLTSIDDVLATGGIHWAIVGGESTAKARPMAPLWARNIRTACEVHDVAFWWKQWGKWAPKNGLTHPNADGQFVGFEYLYAHGQTIEGVLDGQQLRQLPKVQP